MGILEISDGREISANRRLGAYVVNQRMGGTYFNGAGDERVRLENVIRLCRGQKSPGLVKSVSPGQVELLQVIVSILELATVEGIDATPKGIVIAFGCPPNHSHRRWVRCTVPRCNVVARVYLD